VKLVVATHKSYSMPAGPAYLPLHVGAAGKPSIGYARDDSGDNISARNANWCELTGLYWAWRNVKADAVGLVHYRRYFVGGHPDRNDMLGSVITHEEIRPMLGRYKVFTPKKRWYVIETLYSHYAHTHDENHFRIVREIITRDCPDYLPAFEKVLKRRWGYMFNMMILRRDMMDDYCSWLFNILFQAFEQVDTTGLSAFDSRFCGRISEILFDVWLENKLQTGAVRPEEVKELPYMEDVNWNYKVKAFLSAKFMKKKYGRSS